MKLLAIAFTLSVFNSVYGQETYKCFLSEVPYNKSPVVIIDATKVDGKEKVEIMIAEDTTSYTPVFKSIVRDHSEDVMALFENKKTGFRLSFYMDETDVMGLADGSIKSPVMNGNVKCMYVANQ